MSRELYHLHPYVEKLCDQHKWLCLKEGIELLITCTFRPEAEQAKLIAEGKSKARISFHNFSNSSGNPCSLAYDVVPIVNGKCDWDSEKWDRIGELGKQVGMCWGGDWKNFKDRPHFEYHIWIDSCSASKLANKIGGTRLPQSYIFHELEKETVKG